MQLRDFSWRKEWPAAAFLAPPLLFLYAHTMPPGATWEDTGMIAAVCRNFGLLHPPGYPLYSLLCAPFAGLSAIFPLNPAQAVALLSACAAAATCILFYEIARRFAAQKAAAFAAALTLGLGARFWSQAIIPEVYALNALLTAAAFVIVLRIILAPHRGRWLWLFFWSGAGLANHWPLFVSVFPAFVIMLAEARRLPDIKTAAMGAAACAAGLSPYLYLVLLPQWGEPLSLFAPPESFGEWFGYVARDIYGDAAREARRGFGFAQCGGSALWSLFLLANEYTFLGGAAAALGAFAFARRHPPARTFAVLFGVLSAPLLAGYLCWNVDGGYAARTTLAAYPLPAMLFAMVLVVAALNCLRPPRNVFCAALLAAAAGAHNWTENDRREDRFAEEYAAAMLESLPQNAAFVVGDDWSFPLFYLHYAEDARQDLLVARRTPGVRERAAGRRLFFDDHSVGENFHDWGIVQEFVPGGAAEKSAIPPPLIALYRRLPERRTAYRRVREWEKSAVRRALMSAGRALTAAEIDGELDAAAATARDAVLQTPEGLFGRMNALLQAGASPAEMRGTMAQLRRAGKVLPDSWRGRLLHIEGVFAYLEAEKTTAGEKWRDSVALDPAADNPALIDLLHLLAAEEKWREYDRLRRRYARVNNPALRESDANCAAAGICGKRE